MRWRPSIYLEDGADEWECDARQFALSEHGLCFHSRLEFTPGTQLSVCLSFARNEEAAAASARAEGIVVECEKTGPRCFRVTLLFLDVAEETRRELRHIAGETSGDAWRQPGRGFR